MFEYRLPDVGEGVSEGEIVAWHVDPGDAVVEDDVLAEVETDKAVVDLPAPVAGTIEALHADVGEVVPVGEVVVTIDPAEGAEPADEGPAEPEGEAAAEEPTAETAPTPGRVFAPPSVRRLAREHGVDLGAVAGSGPGGRITEADVRAAAGAGGADDADVADAITEVAPEADVEAVEAGTTAQAGGDGEVSAGAAAAADRERTLAAPATRKLADELGVDLDAVPTQKTREGEPYVEATDVSAYAEAQEAAQAADAEALGVAGAEAGEPAGGGRETREPYRGVRRTIGERMAESAFSVPQVTHHDRAVVTALVEAREAMKPRAAERGISLTYVPFVLKAVVGGLREHPVLNTSLDEEREEVVYKHYYDVGVATATDAGLMVPVVRNVDETGLLELASRVNELADKARERSIALEELRGGTFSITNFGAIGGEYATPLVNPPETAILGLGAIDKRPVVVDDELEARHTLPLSLSIDHRVIDGAEAAAFVNTVIEYLETPSLLLLE